MKERLFSIIKYLIFLFIGVGLLWLAFKNIDPDAIWLAIKKADYSWIIASMFVALISHLFRAFRWNQLINQMGYKTQTNTTFYAVMTGYLANLAVPRMGEVSRCVVLSKKENIPFSKLFGTVIAERIFDMIILILIITSIILFQIDKIGSFINDLIIKPLVGSYTNNLSAAFILFGFGVLILALTYISYRIAKPRLKKYRFFVKIEEILKDILKGFKTIAKVKNKWFFFFNTFMIWFLYLIMLMLPFYSFEETAHLNILDGMTILAIGSLGMVAPVPGGIGAYHFLITELLTKLYLIPAFAAAAFATASHAAQTLIILIAGSLSYLLLISKKTKPLNEPYKRN